MRWPFRGARLGLALLPLVVASGALLGLGETVFHALGPKPPRGVPGFDGPDPLAYVALGMSTVALPALVAALLVPLRRVGWAIFWVGLGAFLPTAFGFFDHLVHERNWSGFALHSGGWPHLARVAGVAGLLALIAILLAAPLARRWLRRLESAHRTRTALGWGLALSALGPILLAVLLRAPPLQDKDAAERPNVLVVTIDTLRQDAVGAYGGPSTPELDEWIAQGVRADGWAPSPWTRPSMAALFAAAGVTATAAEGESPVYPGVEWWPERLRDAGYVTQAVVCNPHLAARFGFDRGFEGFDHAGELERLDRIGQSVWARWLTRQVRGRFDPSRGDRIADRAVKWLAQADDLHAPWLLWVHLLDPHLPYHLRGAGGSLTESDPPGWWSDLASDLDAGAFRDLVGARDGERVADPNAREALRRLYLSEVGFVDHQAGRIWRAAREATGERSLLWVVTSDHGEEFWEHGGFEHGHSLHGELLRVPLAVGGLDLPRGAQVGGMKLQDVGPTLLALLGEAPMDLTSAAALGEADSALVPFVLGADHSSRMRRAVPLAMGCRPPDLIAAGMLYGDSRTRVQWSDGLSLWRDDVSGTLRINDVCLDPLEEELASLDVASESQRRLLQILSAWRGRLEDRQGTAEIDPELREQLRAIGYLE